MLPQTMSGKILSFSLEPLRDRHPSVIVLQSEIRVKPTVTPHTFTQWHHTHHTHSHSDTSYTVTQWHSHRVTPSDRDTQSHSDTSDRDTQSHSDTLVFSKTWLKTWYYSPDSDNGFCQEEDASLGGVHDWSSDSSEVWDGEGGFQQSDESYWTK